MPRCLAGEVRRLLRTASLVALFACGGAAQAQAPAIRALFLGDDGHHAPRERFLQIKPVLEARGILLTYTDRVADLSPATLAGYDCLIVYANTTAIPPAAEQALLDFVAAGKGFVPLH